MKIDSITIEGFRSVKGPLTIKLGQIAALIGANNVGKSNILSAIYRVLGRDWVTVNTFDEDDVFNNDHDQDIRIDIVFSEPFKHEQFKEIFIDIPKLRFLYTRYKVGENKGKRRLEKKCLKLDDNVVFKYKERPKKNQKQEFEPFTTIPQEIQESIPVIYIGIDRSLEFYKSLELFVVENDFRINATELGGGFQNAIVISIVKAFEERRKQGAIFLIEEPEMFLHPQMQRSLYKTIRNIGKTNQVIYITHSPHFVTIPEFDEIRIITKTKEGTQYVQSSLPSDEKLKEKFRKELDPERNELFFANRLLIVEGDTEKLALPEYAKRLKVDIDRSGSTIIEVGGKRNIEDFVKLALSLQIPVGFVYDIESSDFGKDQKDKEKEYNAMLDKYAEKGVSIWQLAKNYESQLRTDFGEDAYQKYCKKHGGYSPAVRARLFANDEEIPVPKFIEPIIKWITA